MDLERIARQLKPLKPKQVHPWQTVRQFADPQLKALLDRELVLLSRRTLGDVNNKILLSLPPQHVIRGQIKLGTVHYEKAHWQAGISKEELTRHVTIVGTSGTGKTNTLFYILLQLMEKGVPFVLFDWKQTGRHLIPLAKKPLKVYTPGRSLSPFPFNPFIPPPSMEPEVYVNQVIRAIEEAFAPGSGIALTLQKGILACYKEGITAPTVDDVLAKIEEMRTIGRATAWKTSAVKDLESIKYADLTATNPASQEELVQLLLNSSTVIELDGLPHRAEHFLISLLCLWLYHMRKASQEREKLKLVIVLEEAHNILSRSSRSRELIVEKILKEAREFGIGFIIVDLNPSKLPVSVLGNCYTTIAMNLKASEDVNKAAGICRLDEHEKHSLHSLPRGYGVVKLQGRWREPFLVQVPLMQVPKGAVTDSLLKAFVRGSVTLSGLKQAVAGKFGQNRQFPLTDKGLERDALRMIEDILAHPTSGVGERYQRLGWGMNKGHRIVSELRDSGILETQQVTVGRTRKRLVRVSVDAKQKLGLTQDGVRQESLCASGKRA